MSDMTQYFIGRIDVIKRILDRLETCDSPENESLVMRLCGIGGIDKTAILK